MSELQRTLFLDKHRELGATIVEFGGWEMPIQYPNGIISEHMATRTAAGIFDVSHMGRLSFTGADALNFLQHVLTNNAQALRVGESQYTLIQNENGGAIDDAYLYRFKAEEYLLVVNASNREKDIAHFEQHLAGFTEVQMIDRTFEIAMISLQGPGSKAVIEEIVSAGQLPEPAKNCLAVVKIDGIETCLARTGYTGEPLGFELFVENQYGLPIWELLMEKGAQPIGLGARDTLRLEACLPLYGHELGTDHDGVEIPVFASKLSKFAVSFSPLKGEFIGKKALLSQQAALKNILEDRLDAISALPRMVMPLAVTGKGIARDGFRVFDGEKHVGYITSGTIIPYQEAGGNKLESEFKNDIQKRSITLALIDSDIREGKNLEVEIRKKRTECVVVPYHMSSEAPPYVRSIPYDQLRSFIVKEDKVKYTDLARNLIAKAATNHSWRQRQCINLIPSEMSQSYLCRLLSISDPVNRYGEHKEVKAFCSEDIFYYQGTGFIEEVEYLLNRELRTFFGCRNVESRAISGQMANTAFYSALVDFSNRADRKSEQRRIGKIINNHIIKGGHLSAQPMGALRDFVARDPNTEKPAVVNFPVLPHNPYKIDIKACREVIQKEQPELIILGKSMIIHKEPVAQIRRLVDEFAPSCIIMYDMAHVLGLYGQHFQSPLAEGAHVITGSTHKTYFGTQRGVIASDFAEDHIEYGLWEAVQRRTFPGSVSNHHLGTMTGLLMAAYEMNHFRDDFQQAVIKNAKAFALSLKDAGLDVAGDQRINFTETHQVIVNVGYGRGAAAARTLEENNIIVNFQATPTEEGFTASGALRMGVSEMTRFGMREKDFAALAGLIADLINKGSAVKDEVVQLREQFLEMQYCFKDDDLETATASLFDAFK